MTEELLFKKLNLLPNEKINVGLSKQLKGHMHKFFIDSKSKLKKLSENLEKGDVNNLRSVLQIKPYNAPTYIKKSIKKSIKKQKSIKKNLVKRVVHTFMEFKETILWHQPDTIVNPQAPSRTMIIFLII